MRKIAVVLLLSGAASLLAAPAFAACGASVPMGHAVTWFQIPDAGRVSASAYQLTSPTTVHTGLLDIACEQFDVALNCLFNPNDLGDQIVTIETDWGNAGIIGCPVVGTPPDPQRIVIVVQGTDGSGAALSVQGDQGYIMEYAHPSPDCSSFSPLVAAAGKPTLVTFDGTNLMMQCHPVPLFTDCDPGSCGEVAGVCTDAFTNASITGSVYEKVAPCGTDPGTNRGSWTLRSTNPANGTANIPVTRPATDMCLYVGCTSRLGAGQTESGAVTGYIQIAGALAPSARALDVRAAQAQGNVQVIWRTESEFELAGFNILAHGSKGTVKVNDLLIAPKGNGSGYTEMVSMGSLKGAKSISVEAVLTNGGPSNITGPIDIGK